MHDNIRAFHLRGEIPDSNLIAEKKKLVDELETTMRDNGHAPVLDLNPQFTLDYKDDKYQFRLTVYGVKVKDAWAVTGISDGKILNSTTPRKLSLS